MISFLNGFILPALFAALIPVILHFLSKKKARKVPFSSLKFLKVIENQRIKRLKLFQVLLIIVRTLFIVFLVLAFSRPTISTLTGGTSNAQTTAVILLDDSYSMQSFAYSKTYFELAKEKALELMTSFSSDDHTFLLSSSLENPIALTKENAGQVLSKLDAGNSVFDLKNALGVADSVFRENLNLNNELYLISDFRMQKTIIDSARFSSINNFRAYKIQIARGIPFRNISIDTLIVQNQLYELNKPFNITVRLTNHDQEDVESNLNLFNGSERVAMEFVSLKAAETKSFEIKYIPKTEGIHFLKVQLEEDDLSFDNSWYFSFYMREEIKTLFISDNTTQSFKAALKILSDNTIFTFTLVGSNQWPGTNLFNYDLIIFNDLKPMDNNAVSKLTDYMQLQRSVVIIPGLSATPGIYNAFFRSVIQRDLFDSMQDATAEGFYSLENQKTANAIFNSLFRDKQSSFSAPRVYRYFKQKNYGQTLIRLSNNDPFITQTEALVVFSSSLSGEWSDMEINGLFLPLLYRSFYHAAQNKIPVSDINKVGSNIIFTVQGATIDKNYFIQNPSAEKFSVIPKPLNNNLVFDGGAARENGFYILMNDKGPIATKAVNHSSEELQKPYIENGDLGFDISDLENSNFINQVQDARLGFELWIICIILAFLMLIAEMILIKIIEGTPFLKRT